MKYFDVYSSIFPFRIKRPCRLWFRCATLRVRERLEPEDILSFFLFVVSTRCLVPTLEPRLYLGSCCVGLHLVGKHSLSRIFPFPGLNSRPLVKEETAPSAAPHPWVVNQKTLEMRKDYLFFWREKSGELESVNLFCSVQSYHSWENVETYFRCDISGGRWHDNG